MWFTEENGFLSYSKPFIYGKLEGRGLATTIKAAKEIS